MSTVNSYWEKYRERNKVQDLNKAMMDKQTYISFLEVQLERVSQAVTVTQGFSDRIETLQGQLNTAEDKILNLTRLVKLQQTYAESQEEEIQKLKDSVKHNKRAAFAEEDTQQLEKRLDNVEDFLSKLNNSKRPQESNLLKETEDKVKAMLEKASEEIEHKQKYLQKQIDSSIEQCNRELTQDYKALHRKVQKLGESSGLASFGKKDGFEYAESEGDLKEELNKLTYRVTRLENFKDYIEDISTKRDKEISQLTETSQTQDFTGKLKTFSKRMDDLEKFLLASAEEIKKLQKPTQTFANPISPFKQTSLKKSPRFATSSSFSQTDIKRPTSATPPSRSKSLTKFKKSKTPKSRSPVPKKNSRLSSASPKSTMKSKAMEASIRSKLKQIKSREAADKKRNEKTMKKGDVKMTSKKGKKSKVSERLYQETFNKRGN